jgi:hypothetical protein
MTAMREAEIEQAIQASGVTAPRLTPEDIDSVIRVEHFFVVPDTTATVCCLILRNGFVVVGSSGCVSKENFSEEIGRHLARQEARGKIWELEGYLLRDRLYRNEHDA